VTLIIPALLAKKVNAPVMMRISAKRNVIGRARAESPGQDESWFFQRGKILGLDMFVISNNGPYDGQWRCSFVGPHRFAALSVPSDALAWSDDSDEYAAAQRAELPGGMQGIAIMEPVIAKAARRLGWIKWPSAVSTVQRARRRSDQSRAATAKRPPCNEAHSSKRRSTGRGTISNGTSESRRTPETKRYEGAEALGSR